MERDQQLEAIEQGFKDLGKMEGMTKALSELAVTATEDDIDTIGRYKADLLLMNEKYGFNTVSISYEGNHTPIHNAIVAHEGGDNIISKLWAWIKSMWGKLFGSDGKSVSEKAVKANKKLEKSIDKSLSYIKDNPEKLKAIKDFGSFTKIIAEKFPLILLAHGDGKANFKSLLAAMEKYNSVPSTLQWAEVGDYVEGKKFKEVSFVNNEVNGLMKFMKAGYTDPAVDFTPETGGKIAAHDIIALAGRYFTSMKTTVKDGKYSFSVNSNTVSQKTVDKLIKDGNGSDVTYSILDKLSDIASENKFSDHNPIEDLIADGIKYMESKKEDKAKKIKSLTKPYFKADKTICGAKTSVLSSVDTLLSDVVSKMESAPEASNEDDSSDYKAFFYTDEIL